MEKMNLTFVNVGYGEAILVRCPHPASPGGLFTMLIDGGSGLPEEYRNQPSGRLPAAEYLRRCGLDHLDAMVSTHIHEDHLCGLMALPEALMPKVLWQSLPLDFCRRVMHPLPASGGTVSRDNFLRSLNDACLSWSGCWRRGAVWRTWGPVWSVPSAPGSRCGSSPRLRQPVRS